MSATNDSEGMSPTQPEASTSHNARPTTPSQPTQPAMDKSPLHNRRSGIRKYASQKVDAEVDKAMLYTETFEHIIGPMPVGTYLDKFLPMNGEPLELGGFDFKSVLYDTDGKMRKELQMYKPFIDGVNGMEGISIRLVETAHKSSESSDPRPDVGLYRNDTGKGFDDMESWIEFKIKYDPFKDDDPDAFIRNSMAARSIVGQLVSYGAAHINSNFRTHALSVLVFGNKARLIRWDRAGVVVSESFDYTETSHLNEFFMRFDRLTPEQRGFDMSVTVPDEVEGEMAKAALQKEENFNSQEYEITKMRKFAVPHDGRMKYFVGWIPNAKEMSVVGRNSRGAPVYDIETGDVRWLKDTWRPDANDLDAEAKSYNTLHTTKCRNIMGVIATGDICSLSGSVQTTITDTLITKDWVHGDKDKMKNTFQKYTHFRLVLDEVGRDLTSFKSTRELLGAIINAIEALIDAYFKADILHRDISPGNIVITKDGKGKLIDWDLCRPRNRTGAYTRGYTGTWQFVSGLLLQNPYTKHHDLADDLESVLHVLTWTLLCYSESTLNSYGLAKSLNMYDEHLQDLEKPNRSEGGRMKAAALRGVGGYLPEQLEFEIRPGLSSCIHSIAHLFIPLYAPKKFRTPEQEKQIRDMVESLGKNGGVDMIKLIQDLLKEAECLHEADPKVWPLDDEAEKNMVGPMKISIGREKIPSSKRNRSHRSATKRSSTRASMQNLQESDEEEGGEEDRAQKKARRVHK